MNTTTEIKCPKCNDTGAWGETTPPERISANITMTGALITHLCECRKSMVRAHGQVKWWQTENVKSIDVPLIIDKAVITIETELPIDADNKPLIRDASNLYWPSFARIEGVSESSFTSPDLRAIAKGLMQAADEMDAIDKTRGELVNPTEEASATNA